MFILIGSDSSRFRTSIRKSLDWLSLSHSFMYLAQYMPSLINATGGVARIEELLRETPRVADAAKVVELGPLQDAIELQDVRLGSGKSTVLNLLLRFYDPDSHYSRFSDPVLDESVHDAADDGFAPDLKKRLVGLVGKGTHAAAIASREDYGSQRGRLSVDCFNLIYVNACETVAGDMATGLRPSLHALQTQPQQ